MPTFKLKTPLAEFELNLSEFASIVKELFVVDLTADARQSLKTLIAEARKSFDVVIDILTPLYALNNESLLRSTFPQLFANFKNTYLKNSDEIRTHCHIVNDQIDKLIEKENWKKHLPLVGKSLERLKRSKDQWMGNDSALADRMQNLLWQVNDNLSDLNTQLGQDANAAFIAMTSLLKESEPELLKLKKSLDELRVISAKL